MNRWIQDKGSHCLIWSVNSNAGQRRRRQGLPVISKPTACVPVWSGERLVYGGTQGAR